MKYIYFDESIQDKGGFIIGGFVCTRENPQNYIGALLEEKGFDPNKEEFKSSTLFNKYPKMIDVRSNLKQYLSRKCQIGLMILPRKNREDLGREAIKGLCQLMNNNQLGGDLDINFDQGVFKSVKAGNDIIKQYEFQGCTFNIEQDSIKVRGIQLADLVAHTCSIMLLDQMALNSKKVKAGNNSGYDPDMDIELSFELWVSIRYNFFCRRKENVNDERLLPYYDVEPYGLYISSLCDETLSMNARGRFGESYLGCIH